MYQVRLQLYSKYYLAIGYQLTLTSPPPPATAQPTKGSKFTGTKVGPLACEPLPSPAAAKGYSGDLGQKLFGDSLC